MTIFNTAYETSVCSSFRIKDVQDKLKAARAAGGLRRATIRTSHNPTGFTLLMLEGGNSMADAVPYFQHPLVLEKQEDDVTLALDVRAFGKWYAPDSAFVVRNRTEYEWSVRRAILNYLWMTERRELLRDISPVPAATYSALVSEAVSRRFALDNAERIQLQVLATYFYYCLFSDDRELEDFARDKIMGTIARTTKVPADKVYEWLENVAPIRDLTDFCKAAQQLTQSVALQDFNLRTFAAIMGGTWFGTNARETILVALEHPPTWIMAVAASLSEASFKRSSLAKISERYAKAGVGDNFVKALDVLVGGAGVAQVSLEEYALEGGADPLATSKD